MGEGEEVVELPQLGRRVHWLLAAAGDHGAGRPGLIGGLGGRICGGRGRGLLLGLLDPERSGAGDDVEQPADVRDGELLRVLLFDDAEVAGLQGGDLHRVLELGPTDLVGEGEAGDVAGVHVDGQELPDVEDPVRRYALEREVGVVRRLHGHVQHRRQNFLFLLLLVALGLGLGLPRLGSHAARPALATLAFAAAAAAPADLDGSLAGKFYPEFTTEWESEGTAGAATVLLALRSCCEVVKRRRRGDSEGASERGGLERG